MIKKYKKRPISIEALQWTGDNPEEVREFVGDLLSYDINVDIEMIKEYVNKRGDLNDNATESYFVIKTLEGNHLTTISDYIIKGVRGEFYPCKEDIFLETYEEAND